MTNLSPRRWQIPQLRVTFLLLMVTLLLATTSCASPPDREELAAVPCPAKPAVKLTFSFDADAVAGLPPDIRQRLTEILTTNAGSSKPSTIIVSLRVNGGAAACLDITPMVGSEFLKNSQLPRAISRILDGLDDWIRVQALSNPLLATPTATTARCPRAIDVTFQANFVLLSRGARSELEQWYGACKASNCLIRIGGYASPDGETQGLNEGLPEGRAHVVRTFLIDLDPGAAERIVSAKGRGIDRNPHRPRTDKRRAVLTCTSRETR